MFNSFIHSDFTHSPPQRLCGLCSFYIVVCFLSTQVWLAGSSGLGREVGMQGERAGGVKRGHCGHLEIMGNHTNKLAGKDGILPVTPVSAVFKFGT